MHVILKFVGVTPEALTALHKVLGEAKPISLKYPVQLPEEEVEKGGRVRAERDIDLLVKDCPDGSREIRSFDCLSPYVELLSARLREKNSYTVVLKVEAIRPKVRLGSKVGGLGHRLLGKSNEGCSNEGDFYVPIGAIKSLCDAVGIFPAEPKFVENGF